MGPSTESGGVSPGRGVRTEDRRPTEGVVYSQLTPGPDLAGTNPEVRVGVGTGFIRDSLRPTYFLVDVNTFIDRKPLVIPLS